MKNLKNYKKTKNIDNKHIFLAIKRGRPTKNKSKQKKSDKLKNKVLENKKQQLDNYEYNNYGEVKYKNNNNHILIEEKNLELSKSIDFHFLLDNKKIWTRYLNLDCKNDKNSFHYFYEKVIDISKLHNNNIKLLFEILLKIDNLIKSYESKIHAEIELDNKTKIYDKWHIYLFKDYSLDFWKRKSNISNYKKRYNNNIQNICEGKLQRIMNCLGWYYELENESFLNYFWFLWFLPNELLLIWASKLFLIEKNDSWWLKLIYDWKQYWIEILRNKGIKSWIKSFVKNNDEIN